MYNEPGPDIKTQLENKHRVTHKLLFFAFPSLPSNGCGTFSSSTCTIFEGSLEKGTVDVRELA
jgi:hypothetical protein